MRRDLHHFVWVLLRRNRHAKWRHAKWWLRRNTHFSNMFFEIGRFHVRFHIVHWIKIRCEIRRLHELKSNMRSDVETSDRQKMHQKKDWKGVAGHTIREFVPQHTSEFKSNQNLYSTLYREIPRDLIFSILTNWIKSPHHSGFWLPFNSAFRFISHGTGFNARTMMITDWCT